jgi:tungstate transport system substrate-binding protein
MHQPFRQTRDDAGSNHLQLTQPAMGLRRRRPRFGFEQFAILTNVRRIDPVSFVLQLWEESGIDIDKEKGPWYKSIGQGMGAALNTAGGAGNAYVLYDRGTWIHFRNKGDLRILVEGDKRMFNQYGVMLVNPQKHPNVKKELGQQFIDYLVSPEGQKDIAGYMIDGVQLFYPSADDAGA